MIGNGNQSLALLIPFRLHASIHLFQFNYIEAPRSKLRGIRFKQCILDLFFELFNP